LQIVVETPVMVSVYSGDGHWSPVSRVSMVSTAPQSLNQTIFSQQQSTVGHWIQNIVQTSDYQVIIDTVLAKYLKNNSINFLLKVILSCFISIKIFPLNSKDSTELIPIRSSSWIIPVTQVVHWVVHLELII